MSQTAFVAPNLWSLSGGGIYVGSDINQNPCRYNINSRSPKWLT